MPSPVKYIPFLNFFKNEGEDHLSSWLRSLSLLSFLIAFIVFTDYFLPLKTETHRIENLIARSNFEDITYSTYLKNDIRTGEDEFWIITDKDEFAVSEGVIQKQNYSDSLIVYSTSMFGLNVKLKNKTAKTDDYFYPYINVYGFFILFPIAFILIFILNIVFKRKSELILTLGVINIILLVSFGFLVLFY